MFISAMAVEILRAHILSTVIDLSGETLHGFDGITRELVNTGSTPTPTPRARGSQAGFAAS